MYRKGQVSSKSPRARAVGEPFPSTTGFSKKEILQDIEIMRCNRYSSSDVKVLSRLTSTCFAVRLHNRDAVERKAPPATRSCNDGFQDFMKDLKLLKLMRGSKGICEFLGCVLDQNQRLDGYVYEAPWVHTVPMLFHILNSRSQLIPWSVKELWSLQIAKAMADLHSRRITVGVVLRWRVGLRIDGSMFLQNFISDTTQLDKGKGETPPELRSFPTQPRYEDLDTRTDVFELGMELWLLAEQRSNITGHRCSRYACTQIPRTRCTAAPGYMGGIIRRCRTTHPAERPTARWVAETIKAHDGIRACPKSVLDLIKSCLPLTSSAHCDECGEVSYDVLYHCHVCGGGDFDLCESCVEKGISCLVADHQLVRRVHKNGWFVDEI